MTPVAKKKEEADAEVDTKIVGVMRSGDQIILPEGMSEDTAILWLQRKKEEEQREVAIHAQIPGYHPLDAAHAFNLALAELYGWTSLVPTPGFFGSTPPQMLSIVVDAEGTTRQIPWGRVKVPRITGFLNTSVAPGSNGKPAFTIGGTTKQKDMGQVGRIVAKTQELLREKSIYRGKAVRVTFDDDNPMIAPEFMDLRGVDQRGLVFSKAIEELVDTTLWTPIRNSDDARGMNIPLKRGFLLEGPYGTGKTLCARVTAELATRYGWTFIYLESVNDLKQALDFAQMYQPAIVFAEDIDRLDDGGRQEPFNELLNTIDGVEYKRSEIFTILTTNHVERLHKSMLRPGRLDVVIEVREPDAEAAARLLALYSGALLDPETDLTEAGRLFAGNSPAILNEVVQRAKLAALRRGGSLMLKGGDFETSIRSLEPQLRLMKGDAIQPRKSIEIAAAELGNALLGSATKDLQDQMSVIKEMIENR